MPLPSSLSDGVPIARASRRARRERSGAWAPRRIAKRAAHWKRPSKARVRALSERLRAIHGRAVNEPHGDPIAELVRTVLSQNTNDRNRDVAYSRMRERFPTWEQVRDAPVEELTEALAPGGLAPTKAPRIQAILRELDDDPDLDWLGDAPRGEALEFLTSLPGVGRKTAACVLIFSFDLPEIPVDTHVYRVGGRLGLFRPNASFEEAHDEILAITRPEDAYELHVNLIRHGRTICRPKPRCTECELRRMCVWWRTGGRAVAGAAAERAPAAGMLPRP